MAQEPRIGLVLGAGGVIGGAWHAGALAALERVTGWSPATASHLVGTSAGSVFAALTAAGVHSQEMLAPIDGMLEALGQESAYRHPTRLPGVLPGSLGLTLTSLRSLDRGQLLKAVSGLMPRGLVSTAPIRRTVKRVVPSGWAGHPHCWIVCCDYVSGRRIVFGRSGAPPAHLADAVAASCAIPGFFRPVAVAGRLCMDGGLHSLNNLDVLVGQGLDLVICLSPMSARFSVPGWGPGHLLGEAIRRAAAHQVDHEVAQLTRAGTKVLVIEPTAYDLEIMGHNFMETRYLDAVTFLAQRSVARQLADRQVLPLLRLLRPARRRSA